MVDSVAQFGAGGPLDPYATALGPEKNVLTERDSSHAKVWASVADDVLRCPERLHSSEGRKPVGLNVLTELGRPLAALAGVEGTINQALDVTDPRWARYRGLPRTSLQHAYSAAAINVIRLDAHGAENPRRPRTSRLSQLAHQLAV